MVTSRIRDTNTLDPALWLLATVSSSPKIEPETQTAQFISHRRRKSAKNVCQMNSVRKLHRSSGMEVYLTKEYLVGLTVMLYGDGINTSKLSTAFRTPIALRLNISIPYFASQKPLETQPRRFSASYHASTPGCSCLPSPQLSLHSPPSATENGTHKGTLHNARLAVETSNLPP